MTFTVGKTYRHKITCQEGKCVAILSNGDPVLERKTSTGEVYAHDLACSMNLHRFWTEVYSVAAPPENIIGYVNYYGDRLPPLRFGFHYKTKDEAKEAGAGINGAFLCKIVEIEGEDG